MAGSRFKLLLLLATLTVSIYAEAAPGVVEPPNQPPKNETPAEKDGSQPVNLIFPRVESIDNVECDDEKAKEGVFVNCTIDFRTRIIKYRIQNYDFTKQTGELVKLDTTHKLPYLKRENVYINGEEFEFSTLEKRAEEWLANYKGGLLWNREDMPDFVVCDAYTKFTSNDVEYQLCIHDGTINICNLETKELFASAPTLDMAYLHDYITQFTSAYVYNPITGSSNLTMYLFWTDAVGRMTISKLTAVRYKIEAETEPAKAKANNYLELSMIPNPITKDYKITWPKDSNFLSKKPQLVEKFKADLEKKWRSDFIMAASPIYLSFNTRNATNQTRAEAKVDTIGLCFVRGYRMFETTENGMTTNFDCRKNGLSQSKFVDLPKLQRPFLLATHAYHVVNVDGYRFLHLFYTLKHHDQNQNRYVFCRQKGEYMPDQDASSDILSNIVAAQLSSNPTEILDSYCRVFGDNARHRLHVSPSDIIAYYDGKVVKTITLWGLLYTVSNYDAPIEVGLRDTAPKPKVLANIQFRINAAFSTGQTVYLFTHNNFILIAGMKMDSSYETLTIDFENAGEVYAEEFIFNNFLRPKGDTQVLKKPYIDGFYEYQKDATDTVPSIDNSTGEISKPEGNDDKPEVKPEGKPETKKTSTIWLIVLIIIIAALILAALAYLFFIRGGDEQTAVEPKSAQKSARKSVRKSPQPGLDMESNMKTVRSQHQSTIGAGKSAVNLTKSPSQKSTIKSPGKKSAIAKSPSQKSGIKSPSQKSGTKSPAQKSSTKSPSQSSGTKSPSKKSTVKSPLKSIIRLPAQGTGTKSGKKSKRKSQKSPAKSPTGKTIEKTVASKH